MEKIVYLALGSDLVSVKLHPTIQTVGQAKAFIFDHGLAPKSKYIAIITIKANKKFRMSVDLQRKNYARYRTISLASSRNCILYSISQ